MPSAGASRSSPGVIGVVLDRTKLNGFILLSFQDSQVPERRICGVAVAALLALSFAYASGDEVGKQAVLGGVRAQ